MKFLWPEMRWLALLLPLFVLLYVWLLRRGRKAVLRYASLVLVKDALGKGAGWQRRVPPALFLAAFGALVLAAARPTAVIQLPTQQQTIVMTMDVSGSMRATDVSYGIDKVFGLDKRGCRVFHGKPFSHMSFLDSTIFRSSHDFHLSARTPVCFPVHLDFLLSRPGPAPVSG